MGPQKNNQVKKEIIAKVRAHAQAILAACDEAEVGKINAEEFEKRITKASNAKVLTTSMNPMAEF